MKERLNDMEKDNVNQIALIHSNIQALCPEENIYKLNDELNKRSQRMKIPRAIEEYGGGSGTGKATYESDLFKVVLWLLSNGKKHKTCIEIKSCYGDEMEFDGKHVFINDSECVEQMNADEILNAFAEIKHTNHNKGLADKAEEIRKALAI